MAAKRKSKKRGAHGRAGRQQTSPPPSPALAQKALRSGHYREAVVQFKGLLKNEPKAEWREGLAAAYAGRARELEAKGMLKEALAIWENRRQLHPSDPLATEHVTLLLRLGQVEQAVQACGQALGTLDRQAAEGLRAHCAALHLFAGASLEGVLPADDPVVSHAGPARDALTAYCAGDDVAAEAALKCIPFRSPYRDWAQLLKALLRLPGKEVSTLLDRIPADSPFAPLVQAARLALLSEADALAAMGQLGVAARRFAAVLRGWPERRLALWEALHREGEAPAPRRLLRVMWEHRAELGEDWVRQHALRLLVHEYPRSLDWFQATGMGRLSGAEKTLVAAWHAEESRNPWNITDAWLDAISVLRGTSDPAPDSDAALRLALMHRRLEERWHLLNGPGELRHTVLKQLEQSLRFDPSDRPTYQRLIAYYRAQGQLKDARRLLDEALARWPEDVEVLGEALETSLAGNAFKKAAGFARRILAVDPINRQARDRLLEAHLSHARKQVHKDRHDLAHKELEDAMEWARDARAKARLDLVRGFVDLVEDEAQGQAALRTAYQALGGDLAARLDLALEAERLRHSPEALIKTLGLPKPGHPERAELMAWLHRIRAELDAGQDLPRAVLLYFEPMLKGGAKLDLSRPESESLCETLARLQLNEPRLTYARAALRRWPGEPLFELHAFEARHAGRYWTARDQEVERLEEALERARAAGDMRTVHRIAGVLEAATGFPLSGPFPVLGGPDDDEDLDEFDLNEFPADLSPEDLLELLLSLGEVPPEVRALEKQLGPEAFRELILEFLSEMKGESSGGGPFRSRRPKGRKPRPGKSKNPSSDQDDDAEAPNSDQLDLF